MKKKGNESSKIVFSIKNKNKTEEEENDDDEEFC